MLQEPAPAGTPNSQFQFSQKLQMWYYKIVQIVQSFRTLIMVGVVVVALLDQRRI
jgi:hypothetical protein